MSMSQDFWRGAAITAGVLVALFVIGILLGAIKKV